MNLIKFNKIFKNKTNIEVAKYIGISSAMIGQMKSFKNYPSHQLIKKFFIKTNGKMQPNDFFPISEWQQELQSHKQNKKDEQ